MIGPFDIRQADLADPQVLALLALHLQGMRDSSPPEHVFALDVAGLRAPEVTVFGAWRDDRLAGIGALKRLGNGTGEIKSMRTSPQWLRCGVASCLLQHIRQRATEEGLTRLSLETGTGGPFEAALAFYRRHGFSEGKAFGEYPESDFSRFFHLSLAVQDADVPER